MSYCRFAEGDVYMYSGGDEIVCCGCILGGDFTFNNRTKALAHLEKHVQAKELGENL